MDQCKGVVDQLNIQKHIVIFSYFFLPALQATFSVFLLLFTVRNGLLVVVEVGHWCHQSASFSFFNQIFDDHIFDVLVMKISRCVLLLFCTTPEFFLTLNGRTTSSHCDQFQTFNHFSFSQS